MIYKFEEICILVERETNEKMKQKINRKLKEVEVKLEKTKDKRKYIDEIANDRTQIKNEIKRLDIIMADKNKIKDEFKNRNKELPIKEKIFSIKTLIQMLNNEKEKLKEEYEEKTNLLHPNIFLEKREEEKKKYELLQDKDIEETLIQFQEIFLEAFLMKVESIDKKEDLINVIYEFRYYQMLPFDEKTNIYEKEKLKEKIKEVEEKILEKAIENKVINENIQKEVFHYIFITKIIHLEDIYIQVKEDNKSIIVELSENDQGQCEERFEINKEEINENNIFGCYKDGNRVKLFN